MTGTLPRRPALRAPITVAVVLAAAVAADVAFDPQHRHVPLCPFHALTGWWCPLCGSLRAADALAHLRLGSALHDNVLFVLAVPLLALWWLDWAVRSRSGQTGPRRLSRPVVAALVLVAVVFTVVRNLGPFAALRPVG
jgi:hypothetical protein